MAALSIGIAAVLSIAGAAGQDVAADGGSVTARGVRFHAEVARTAAEHARGLMYRQYLQSDRCMFFVYEEDGHHSIWIKNCYIALDVAWVSEDGTVVEVAENVPPCSPMRGDDCPTYGGNTPSRHFIEFQTGTIRRIGLKVGDRVGWDLRFSDGGSLKGGQEAKETREAKETKETKETKDKKPAPR
jgi:uncharacterized membrane protein (UPF0127 family)